MKKYHHLILTESFKLLLLSTPGFDAGELSENSPDDWEGLDASAAHIANLLSTEPADGTFQGQYFEINYLT